MSQYLSEAFKKLNFLNEETFAVNTDGLEDFIKFEDDDDFVDSIDVIDPEAETEEDLQDSYVGKVILDCCVCHSKIYKDKEDVIIEDDIANVSDECPFCYSVDGYKVIGEVTTFDEDEELDKNTDIDDDLDESYEDTDGVMGEKGKKYTDVDLKAYWEKEKDNDPVLKNYKGDFDAWHKDTTTQMKKVNEGLFDKKNKLNQETKDKMLHGTYTQGRWDKRTAGLGSKAGRRFHTSDAENDEASETKKNEGLFDFAKKKKRPDIKPELVRADEINVGDVVITRNGTEMKVLKISNGSRSSILVFEGPNGETMAAESFMDVKAFRKAYPTTSKNKQSSQGKPDTKLDKKLGVRSTSNQTNGESPETEKNEGLKESVNNIVVETDDDIIGVTPDENGKVTISTEPKSADEPVAEGEETIQPLEPETQSELEDNVGNGEEIEIDVDEFDEESFDELGEQYLHEVYDNVKTFKTTNVAMLNNRLVVEGVIKFKSGSSKKTSFIFESREATKTGKIRFIGENKEIARGKKSFTVTGKVEGTKFLSESLNYNYGVKGANGKAQRLYGTVKRGK